MARAPAAPGAAIPVSMTTSTGPPVMIRCSVSSRRTRIRRRRPSILAWSTTASRAAGGVQTAPRAARCRSCNFAQRKDCCCVAPAAMMNIPKEICHAPSQPERAPLTDPFLRRAFAPGAISYSVRFQVHRWAARHGPIVKWHSCNASARSQSARGRARKACSIFVSSDRAVIAVFSHSPAASPDQLFPCAERRRPAGSWTRTRSTVLYAILTVLNALCVWQRRVTASRLAPRERRHRAAPIFASVSCRWISESASVAGHDRVSRQAQ